MADGELFEEIKDMLKDDSMTLKQIGRLQLRGLTEVYRKLAEWEAWKSGINDRLDELESKDKRFMALVTGVSVFLSSLVTAIVTIMTHNP